MWHELRAAGAVPRREAFGIFSHKINQAARRAGTEDKRREGKVPDLELDPLRRTGPDPVYAEHTLLEHKTVSYGLQYQHAITRRCHVVATRAGKVPGEYRSALRKADRDFNGTPRGTVGPAEALLATFRLVPVRWWWGTLRRAVRVSWISLGVPRVPSPRTGGGPWRSRAP